jgi:signal recognition particle subunit SRP54
MFESLTERLQQTFKELRGHGKLTEKNMSQALRQVKLALLEANVNYKVVKEFTEGVKEQAEGEKVIGSLTPELQIVKIINDELIRLMGNEAERIKIEPSGLTEIMLVGLQGSGKTTASAKLALHFKKSGRNPLLVAADIYRPAAIKQLQLLGEQIEVPVFSMGQKKKPVSICQAAIKQATKNGNDFLIIDTAGRLHIDEPMMEELREIRKAVSPTEILLVADSTTGQDAVNIAEHFNDNLDITGVILTKLDGDARGGAALSIRSVTQKPIKFVSVGEKPDDLEQFHPDRMASRILGQGDIKTLVEKAEQIIDEDKAKELEKKITEKNELDFNDFLEQLQNIQKMGTLDQLIDMVPGLNRFKGLKADETQLKRTEAIINSMTVEERQNYRIINGSRRSRIAKGSGTSVRHVNQLIKQLRQMNTMMRQFTGKGKGRSKRRMMQNVFPF